MDLTSPAPSDAATAARQPPQLDPPRPALVADDIGRPHVRDTTDLRVAVSVPPDIERLRRTDRPLAAEWRAAVRETLCQRLSAGARITDFRSDVGYIVTTGENE